MKSLYPPYFIQTQSWVDFWKKANPVNHFAYEVKNSTGTVWAWVYQYPWFFGQCFFYIPRGPVVDPRCNTSEIEEFWQAVIQKAIQCQATFLRLDTDPAHWDLNQTTLESSLAGISALSQFEVKPSPKSIQYKQTMILELPEISVKVGQRMNNIESIRTDDLQQFFNENTDFWSKTNQNIRRYTRKALTEHWTIDVAKIPENFEEFWRVYQETSERQQFGIHDKSYFQTLFEEPFSHLILLKDVEGKTQACWFGISLNGVLTYLYGGNTEYSLKHHGQYLVHLVAVYLGATLKDQWYDLGGYDPQLGFGRFKEGYRGQIHSFLGPVDIIFDSSKYKTINTVISVVKKIKMLFT